MKIVFDPDKDTVLLGTTGVLVTPPFSGKIIRNAVIEQAAGRRFDTGCALLSDR